MGGLPGEARQKEAGNLRKYILDLSQQFSRITVFFLQQKSLEEEARKHVMAKLEQGFMNRAKSDKSSTASSDTTTTSIVHIEVEKPERRKPIEIEVEDSVSRRHHHKHCHQKHKHRKCRPRCSVCHHHHHNHQNHKTKAKRREELLMEIREGKLVLPKKKTLLRTFSV